MLPIEVKIIKYYLIDQFFFKYKVRKARHSQYYKQSAQYLKHYKQSAEIDSDSPLSTGSFTIFDLETTGFLPELRDEVISIGAVKVENFKIQYDQTFYKVLKPLQPIPNNTKRLTGLKGLDFKNGEHFPTGIAQFLRFCEGSVLVAHPATFDIPFLQKSIQNWKLPGFSPVFVDSFAIANHLHGTKRNYLDTLVSRYQVEKRERHHALNDAIMTAEVFVHLLKECEKQSIYTFADLKRIG